MSGRRTVSYFEHVYDPVSLMDPDMYLDEQGVLHMKDIKEKGFDEVVLCVTELDMATNARRRLLTGLTKAATDHQLLVTADPWRVGGIFGGEGISLYEQNGGKPCICEPKLESLLYNWLDTVVEAGITRVFWDEPELACPDHNLSLELIDRFSQAAVARGINWNSSCVRSRDPNIDMSGKVAALSAIKELAVAPYQWHPQNKSPRPASEVVANIAPWFARIKSAADANGIDCQAWMQGFNISAENIPTLEVYLEEIKKAGIGNVAVWGYEGCKSVPHLNSATAEPASVVWRKMTELMLAA